MKTMRQYTIPSTSEQSIRYLGVLMSSDRVSSNIDIKGGDESGDVTGAF